MAATGEVEEIKSRLDIVEHISGYIELKRSGTNYKGLCPFHGEKTPSFMVNAEKQIFHCFGCGEGGDAITFTMKYEGLSFPEALELLARKTGVTLTRKRGEGAQGSEREALRSIQDEALGFFREHLKKNPAARKYIAGRGIDESSIGKFSLGVSPPGWHGLFEHLSKKGYKREMITRSGLVTEGQKGPYDIFRGRIMFPITDLHGQCIAFGGRVMDGGEPKYLNSPDTELFHKGENLYALALAKEGIRSDGHAVIVEGYMDAIMCHQHGIASAVAPLGTALTEGHLRKLKRFTERLMLLFDGDRAGLAAARRSLDLIMAAAMNCRVLVLPGGEDPDSILNARGAEHMRGLIQKESLTPVEFVLRHTPAETAPRECATMISRCTDPLMRGQLIVEMADRSRINESDIREKVRALLGGAKFRDATRGGPGAQPRPQRKPALKAYNEETLLLSAALMEPSRAGSILEQLGPERIEDDRVRSLLSKLAGPEGGSGALGLAETEDERELVTRLSVEPGFQREDMGQNVQDCIIRIKRRGLDRDIRKAEEAGDLKLLQKLVKDRQNLLRGERGSHEE